jgi:hypothetical protein
MHPQFTLIRMHWILEAKEHGADQTVGAAKGGGLCIPTERDQPVCPQSCGTRFDIYAGSQHRLRD